ncbi:MAG: hypothetical protein ACRDNX_01810 [Gaiellaceae bacterium]
MRIVKALVAFVLTFLVAVTATVFVVSFVGGVGRWEVLAIVLVATAIGVLVARRATTT